MNKAYLLIGGNMGNREENLSKSCELITKHCGEITNMSSLYSTAAWGIGDQPDFLNQVLEIRTMQNARQLIRKILSIEKKMGRERKEKYGPRIIDIDILLFNEEIHKANFLKIPHPELHNRRFALVPLAEIAANAFHPILKKNISELLAECNDTLTVNKI